MPFPVSIITPEKVLPELTAEHVTVVAVDGQLGIRSHHAPIVALIPPLGHVLVRVLGSPSPRVFAVRGGVAQMADNKLKVLTPQAVDVHALDLPAMQRSSAAEKDAGAKTWIDHQLALAAAHPPAVGHV